MELYAQLGNTVAIAVVGFLVWFALRGRFDQTDRRIDELKDDMNRRFDENTRQHERFAADIAGLRSDLTQVALAVGARPGSKASEA